MKICLLSTDDLFLSDSEFNATLASIPFGERDKEELQRGNNFTFSSTGEWVKR